MTLAHLTMVARKAMRRPPSYLLRRLAREARRQAFRPWSRIRPQLLTDAALLRELSQPDVDGLWDTLARDVFFLAPADRPGWRVEFERRYPARSERIVAAAERVLRHEFDLLGSGPCALGAQIPWHRDFKSGHEWPTRYSADLDAYDLRRASDVKVPWELSRCQHFARLGQAYWLTGDERYAREFADEVRDWIDANPWMHGVNWFCAMDVALRAVSWIWGFYFFAGSDACRSRDFRSTFLRSLFLHGEFVAANIETADLNGNHYLVDGVGLVFLGTFFSRSQRASEWLKTGTRMLTDEILAQTTADGVDFEGSIAYHRLVLECFLTSFMLMRMRGQQVPPASWERLERMVEFVAAYTKPNGQAPLLGDADDGRVQILGLQSINDHRYLPAAGAVLFRRPDLKQAAGELCDEAFWLVGPAGAEQFDTLPAAQEAPRSAAFEDAGFYVMRGPDTHLFVDCAEVGFQGLGGHGHNDVLGFELFLNGINLVTDCGAYIYTASKEWRNRFRSTAFHNTVQVDDEELNRFLEGDFWRLAYDAVPVLHEWSPGERFVKFRGAHRGYERLNPGVTHERELVLDKTLNRLEIRDRLIGTDTRRLTSRFHLDPDVVVTSDDRGLRLSAHGRSVYFTMTGGPPGAAVTVEPAWVSQSYGRKLASSCIVIRATAALPAELLYTFDGERASGTPQASRTLAEAGA